MKPSKQLSAHHRSLVTRYLTWVYKSTKESFDRLERKSTQLLVDDFMYQHITQRQDGAKMSKAYLNLVAAHRAYIDKKISMPIDAAQYLYLKHRLEAAEAAVKKFLGVKQLQHIQRDYEKEFTRRIWESKEH